MRSTKHQAKRRYGTSKEHKPIAHSFLCHNITSAQIITFFAEQSKFSYKNIFTNCKNGDTAVDDFFRGNLKLINNFMMALAEEQIKTAFDQAEKEVTDLHGRISEGMREAKKNGIRIGLPKGTTLTTKKSIECKAIIQKHSKDFGGSLDDPEVMKLCGCSRNSYYKYKKELKT
ncbi:MAG: recombinase family protein [Ruminococcaceae bacterium]|nr:recombinase family protein [Oscillospiraceae bacterium]